MFARYWNQWYRRYGRARAALASERGGRSPQERAKRAGHQPAVSPVRAFGERYGTASERGRPAYQQKSTTPGATSTGGSPSGGPVDGATRRAPLLNAGRPRNRHPRRYRRSRFWKGLERSESVARGPALRVGFFAVAGGFLRNLASTGALVRHWQASGHTTLEKMLYTFRVRQTRGNRRGNALHLQVICTNNDVSHAAGEAGLSAAGRGMPLPSSALPQRGIAAILHRSDHEALPPQPRAARSRAPCALVVSMTTDAGARASGPHNDAVSNIPPASGWVGT